MRVSAEAEQNLLGQDKIRNNRQQKKKKKERKRKEERKRPLCAQNPLRATFPYSHGSNFLCLFTCLQSLTHLLMHVGPTLFGVRRKTTAAFVRMLVYTKTQSLLPNSQNLIDLFLVL